MSSLPEASEGVGSVDGEAVRADDAAESEAAVVADGDTVGAAAEVVAAEVGADVDTVAEAVVAVPREDESGVGAVLRAAAISAAVRGRA